MRGSSRMGLGGLMAAAALSVLSVPGVLPAPIPHVVTEQRVSRREKLRSRGTISPWSYPNGPGWTQAQVKRRARKARNVKRNRLSHR